MIQPNVTPPRPSVRVPGPPPSRSRKLTERRHLASVIADALGRWAERHPDGPISREDALIVVLAALASVDDQADTP